MMPPIPSSLALSVLCLAAAVGVSSCSFPSVEERGPVLAFKYHQDGSIDSMYCFTEDAPYPRELNEWIEYNNGKLYYVTMVTYAPCGTTLSFPSQQLHFSFLSDIVYDGSNYRKLTRKDRVFLEWLKSLAWMSNQDADTPSSASFRTKVGR